VGSASSPYRGRSRPWHEGIEDDRHDDATRQRLMDAEILGSLAPVILLLALGVGAAIGSRLSRLSPIVGYIVLGIALKAFNISIVADSGTVQLLSELGVVFLLFDI